LVVESNYFPVSGVSWFSVSFHLAVATVSDHADITFGLVRYDPSYTETHYFCSDQYLQQRIVRAKRTSNQATFTTEVQHGFYLGERVLIEDVDASLDGVFFINDVTDVEFVVTSIGANIPDSLATGRVTVEKKLSAAGGAADKGFVQYQAMVPAPMDSPEMNLRIEITGCSDIWVDNVLVDPHEGQYKYFDGSSTDSFPDDYRWMGGLENNHFSCWYNNYLNTHNRLFSDWDETEGRYKSGLVEEWAPTGATIIDHWDAVTPYTPLNWFGDAFYTVTEVSGSAIAVVDIRSDFQGNVCPAAFL
jgi:hypothetical protein